jgi:hypothetical protein
MKRSNRTTWLLLSAGLCGFLTADLQTIQGEEVKTVREIKADDGARGAISDLYVGNRQPLQPSSLMKLPIGTIKPKGWLRYQDQRAASGGSASERLFRRHPGVEVGP